MRLIKIERKTLKKELKGKKLLVTEQITQTNEYDLSEAVSNFERNEEEIKQMERMLTKEYRDGLKKAISKRKEEMEQDKDLYLKMKAKLKRK